MEVRPEGQSPDVVLNSREIAPFGICSESPLPIECIVEDDACPFSPVRIPYPADRLNDSRTSRECQMELIAV